MDIRNWGLDRIMQLPDWCFGRRFCVSATTMGLAGNPLWDISEIAFPEYIVLWQVTFNTIGTPTVSDYFRLALGDQIPASKAMMDELEPFIPGLGGTGAEPRNIRFSHYASWGLSKLRMPIHTAGRRLILEVDPAGSVQRYVQIMTVVSSIPKEVPDWLCSDVAKVLKECLTIRT